MNALTFSYSGVTLRTAGTPDEPLFVAKDVCDALTIPWRGIETLAALPADWKGVRSFRTPGGEQELITITEAGVYKLAFRSNKPEAEAFTNWVASEVLPAIRKTGKYETPAVALDFSDPLTAARLYIESETAKRELQAQLVEQAPAVAFARQVEVAHNDTGIQHFAKMCGWGPNVLFKELRKRGILFKRDGDNVPKQELIQRGYFKVRQTVDDYGTHARTMLTGKGVLWLSRILKVSITPMLLDDDSSHREAA